MDTVLYYTLVFWIGAFGGASVCGWSVYYASSTPQQRAYNKVCRARAAAKAAECEYMKNFQNAKTGV